MANIQNATAAVKNGGAIAKKKKDPGQRTMMEWVTTYQSQFGKALPSNLKPERFVRMVQSALSQTPDLASCTVDSFLGAAMMAAQLGLEPNTPLGQAYLIPYRDKTVLKARFELGYKGLVDLAYRSGEVQTIAAHVVYENDEFSYSYGLHPDLVHVPYCDGDRGEPTFVYAVFNLKNGGVGFEVMSVRSIRAHAEKYSKSYNSKFSPWQTNFEEMAKKTVLKQLLKLAPMATDTATGIAGDETIQNINLTETTPAGDPIVNTEYIVDETATVSDVPANAESGGTEYAETIQAGA